MDQWHTVSYDRFVSVCVLFASANPISNQIAANVKGKLHQSISYLMFWLKKKKCRYNEPLLCKCYVLYFVSFYFTFYANCIIHVYDIFSVLHHQRIQIIALKCPWITQKLQLCVCVCVLCVLFVLVSCTHERTHYITTLYGMCIVYAMHTIHTTYNQRFTDTT